jgi:hypothetical protein
MRTRAALSVGTVLMSSVGLGMATASPAAAARDCVRHTYQGIGKPAPTWSTCSVTVGRKAIWSYGPDSSCKKYTPGQKRTFYPPYPISAFDGLKACKV